MYGLNHMTYYCSCGYVVVRNLHIIMNLNESFLTWKVQSQNY